MSADPWIVIHNWPEFQHYKDRDPSWIKDYVSQHSHGDYRRLSFHLRGILKDLRLAYASSNGQLLADTRQLSRQLGERVTTRDLESLNHAGLIEFSASKPLALARSREKILRGEKKTAVAHAPKAKAKTGSDEPRSNAGAYTKHQPEPAEPVDRELGLELAKRLADRYKP
jgi:hypothetical protein